MSFLFSFPFHVLSSRFARHVVESIYYFTHVPRAKVCLLVKRKRNIQAYIRSGTLEVYLGLYNDYGHVHIDENTEEILTLYDENGGWKDIIPKLWNLSSNISGCNLT